MNRCLSLVLVGVLAVVAAACQPAAGLTEQDKAAIRKVTDDTIKMTTVHPTDFAAYTKLYYTDDAEMLAANMPPAKGRAAIQRAMEAFPPITDFKTEIVGLEGRGDLAYVRGNYSLTLNPPGAAPVSDRGKYVEVWRKQADGSWKVAYDSFSSDLPMPPFTVPTGTLAADATPEEKALSALVGRWEMEGTVVFDPKAGPVPSKATQSCEWFTGGHAVVCRATDVTAGTTGEAVSVMYYDPAKKSYASTGISSRPAASGSAKIDVRPGTWVFTSEFVIDKKPVKDRMALANMTPEGGTWKYELSVGGGPLMPAGEGKYTKAKLP